MIDQLEIYTKSFIDNLNTNRGADFSYVIPVVVHVIHNYDSENISYSQVDNCINRINEDFQALNDDLSQVIDSFTNIIGFLNMEFRLATIDPDGNCTYGVTKTNSNLTNAAKTNEIMNLINWMIKSI